MKARENDGPAPMPVLPDWTMLKIVGEPQFVEFLAGGNPWSVLRTMDRHIAGHCLLQQEPDRSGIVRSTRWQCLNGRDVDLDWSTIGEAGEGILQ